MARTPEDAVKTQERLNGLMSKTAEYNQTLVDLGEDYASIVSKTLTKSNALLELQEKLGKARKTDWEMLEAMVQTQKDLAKQGDDLVDIQKTYEQAVQNQKDKWVDTQKSLASIKGTIIGIITSPMVWLIAAVGWLAKTFWDWNKAGEEFRINTGIVGDQFAKLNTQAMSVAAELGHLGISQKESLEYTQELVQEFGSIETISRDLVKNTAVLGVTLGLSAEGATKMMSSFMTITAGSSEMSSNMIAFTATLSKSAGVARNMVMKDIADNAESLAGYMKEGGDNIVIAAVQARQLGVSIDTVVSAADKLLEFESSIENQMNAMILTGRQINLDKARGLALSGDLAGLQKEILSQVGSQAEFEKLNVFQRKALAEAFGMSVGELGTMISRQETLKQLTEGSIDAAKAMSQGLSLADVLGTNKEVMSGLTQLTNALVKLGNFVATFLVPTFTVLSTVFGWVADLMNIIFDAVAKAIPGFYDASTGTEHWAATLTKFVVTAGLATGAIMLLKKALKKPAGGQMDLFGGGKAKGGGLLGNLFGGMSWSSIGKFAVVMVVLAASMWLLGKAMQTFVGIEWETLAIAGAAIVGLLVIVGALGALMANPVVTAAIIAGGLAIAGLGLAFNILGEGIQKIGNGLSSVATGLSEIIALALQVGVINDVAAAVQALDVAAEGGGIAAAGNAARAAGTVVGGTQVNVSLDDVVKKLDEIESMFQDGIELKLNGAKIGEWLAKTARA